MSEKYRTYRLADIDKKLQIMRIHPLDVLVTGVTGAGKSTTLNAFFQKEVASVGNGTDPKTMQISSYLLNELCRLWDTPGLGDGPEKDRVHIDNIKRKLRATYGYDRKWGFIDLVLVIIDGSSRDLGTTYHLLERAILPNIDPRRVLIAVNQADMAMKGRHWNYTFHQPDQELQRFLEDKVVSIQQRIRESTGLLVPKPIYYSAVYDYHIDKLYDLLIDHIPVERRKL